MGLRFGILQQGPPPPEPEVSVNPDMLSFECDDASKYSEVYSTGTWDVISQPAWITAFPLSGGSSDILELSPAYNCGGSFRNGYVRVGLRSDNGVYDEIYVEQVGMI